LSLNNKIKEAGENYKKNDMILLKYNFVLISVVLLCEKIIAMYYIYYNNIDNDIISSVRRYHATYC